MAGEKNWFVQKGCMNEEPKTLTQAVFRGVTTRKVPDFSIVGC